MESNENVRQQDMNRHKNSCLGDCLKSADQMDPMANPWQQATMVTHRKETQAWEKKPYTIKKNLQQPVNQKHQSLKLI